MAMSTMVKNIIFKFNLKRGDASLVVVLDRQTLAFVDYKGNQQFISQGNLTENPKAQMFLMDYAHRRRIKIWGEARVVEDDPALLASLMPTDYKARPEQVIVFKITAWDTNWPQRQRRRWRHAMRELPAWKRNWRG
eukprot:gene509-713_t